MKLTYRGIAYTSTTTADSLNSSGKSVTAKYRGATYLMQQCIPAEKAGHKFNLKYRGAYYYPSKVHSADWDWATT